MCLVCWQLPTIQHWTENRDTQASDNRIAGGAPERNRRLERLQRAQVLNRILRYYGLRVDDWIGTIYRLSPNPAMGHGWTIVRTAEGELQPWSRTLASCGRPLKSWTGCRIDPLDPQTSSGPGYATWAKAPLAAKRADGMWQPDAVLEYGVLDLGVAASGSNRGQAIAVWRRGRAGEPGVGLQ